ncbi:Heterogeneous nuclear ribonucleoprotein U-like protein 1 isoform X1 [Oopsacas minuta]|uniref:Heterogeneous nuclear ribonucleoprotein U-like protein 1 isoform X1 n=1 Tax=Oopsacas minuta TaxID=111878 RepID=A0AAV7JNT2_9METZ|nr:Heterogeneous nuclear ribonucleoprotein U-like protein 1 isoform X1 [Oopsacas minuta]
MSTKEEVENEVSEFVSPLKVDKLKAELKRRGVDTTGKKADLVKRLQDIMVNERLQGEDIPLEPENGTPEVVETDLPDDSVHSTTEQQEYNTHKEMQEIPAETVNPECITEQPSHDCLVAPPPIVEMDTVPETKSEGFDASKAPPDSTEKMDDEECQEPKSKPDPVEELPPLDADTVDEDDADQTMQLEPDPYIPPEDQKLILLDLANCELNLQIMDEGLTAQNIQDGPMQLLWAGGRANFGVKEGKFAFECQVLKSLETTIDHDNIPDPGVRVGWSTDRCPFLLGAAPNSYAYDSSGNIVRDRNLTAYGPSFTEGDVITAMINFESDPPEISFSLNGTGIGLAHQTPKGNREAFFPHIATRQFKLQVNFGATPFQHELPEGFLPLTSGTEEQLIKPGERIGDDKEILFIIGLPGCGKTRWVEKFMMNNEGKRYTHVCDESIQPLFFPDVVRKRTFEGDPVSTFKPLAFKSQLLDGFCQLAARKDRHLIIDARSIFKTTQARRMKPFNGFKRIAIVVHPFDNFLSYRQRQVADYIPRPAVLSQMKIAFYIPEEGELFSEVRFPELMKDKVILSLQGEPQWAPRKDNRRRDRYPRMGRGGRRDYRDYRSHPPGPYRGYYGGSHGYNRGGYAPYPMYGGSYGHSQGGYGYGQGSGYSPGGYNSYRGGYYDRRQSGGNRGNKRPRK